MDDKIPGFCHIQHVPRSTYAVLRGNFTELPQDLLNYLRIYWTTSEFTELPQNLLNYLRIYWTTSEFTELPRNFTELPKSFTELPGFLEVQIQVLPGTAEVY